MILPERSESGPCNLIYEWEESEGPVYQEALGHHKKCGVYPVVSWSHGQFERMRVTGLEHICRRLPLTGLWLVGQFGAYSSLLPPEYVCSCYCRVRLFVTLWTVAAWGILQARILEWVAIAHLNSYDNTCCMTSYLYIYSFSSFTVSFQRGEVY